MVTVAVGAVLALLLGSAALAYARRQRLLTR